MKLLLLFLSSCFLLISSSAFASVQTEAIQINFEQSMALTAENPLRLAEAEATQTEPRQEDILDNLDEATSDENAEKKCMMVCEKWGEDCVINPRTGARKCRRVCKQLAQQCF